MASIAEVVEGLENLGTFYAVKDPEGNLIPGSVRETEEDAATTVTVRENRLWPHLSANGWEIVNVLVQQVSERRPQAEAG